VAGSCGYDDEPSDSIKGEAFSYQWDAIKRWRKRNTLFIV
jgi:hypothetical protein